MRRPAILGVHILDKHSADDMNGAHRPRLLHIRNVVVALVRDLTTAVLPGVVHPGLLSHDPSGSRAIYLGKALRVGLSTRSGDDPDADHPPTPVDALTIRDRRFGHTGADDVAGRDLIIGV